MGASNPPIDASKRGTRPWAGGPVGTANNPPSGGKSLEISVSQEPAGLVVEPTSEPEVDAFAKTVPGDINASSRIDERAADSPSNTQHARKTRTGDWTQQPPGSDQASNTHPFFREAGSDATHSNEEPSIHTQPTPKLPTRSLTAVFAILALSIVSAAALLFFRAGRKAGSMSQHSASIASKRSGSEAAPKPKAYRIASTPAKASVFSASNGKFLGKTPLSIRPGSLEGTRVELHMAGHHPAIVDLSDQRNPHITMKTLYDHSTGSSERGTNSSARKPRISTPRANSRPANKPAPPRNHPTGDLIDPF